MSHFFVQRPVLAWVIAISIMLLGVVAIPQLPVSRYPSLAPPAVEIYASYPGAAAKTVEDSVTQVIEQNMTNLDGLNYVSSTSSSNGSASIVLTFAIGTNPDIAQVQVQNKLQQVTPLLPQIVQQQGVAVGKSAGDFQLLVAIVSDDGSTSVGDIDDYVLTEVADPLNRVKGVGTVSIFGSKHAMRIWLDPDKLNLYRLTPSDVTAAIRAQNAQASIGQVGDLPAVAGQQLNVPVTALGRLSTPEQFRNIVLRAGDGNGSALRLGDVARVEIGRTDYSALTRYNGRPASGFGITLAGGANMLTMVQGVKELMEKLKPRMPPGLKVVYPNDTAPFVRASIRGVIATLLEAIALVFLVMLLFLRDLRATLIPTIAIPVVLLGTFAVLAFTGQSINMLTMFALVLAIGLLVDDAIVVVENVERIMSEEGVGPVEATYRSMRQISSALVVIGAGLSAVFIPMSFLHGSVGVIYRQFSITIVSAMVLSVMVALVLTPALCATLLRPPGQRTQWQWGRGFFERFADGFAHVEARYQGFVTHVLARPLRYLGVYLALVAVLCIQFFRLPSAFLPNEDQGFMFALVQAPVGAVQSRTAATLKQVEDYFIQDEKETVASIFTIAGFSFSGGGQNSGFGFVQLKDWQARQSSDGSVQALLGRAGEAFAKIKDAQIAVFAPPPAPDLGSSEGFDFFLKDEYGQGHQALTAARDQFLSLAAQSKVIANARANGQDDTPQLQLDIDPQKVASLGLSMSDVAEALSIAWGGRYIDDFIDQGRVKRVIVQADAPYRMTPEDFSRWHLRNSHGDMVSVASFSNPRWGFASPRLERYNGFSAMEIAGEAAPGFSTGDAMNEVERLASKLPLGFSAEFTKQSFEERGAGAQAPLFYAFSLSVVFLWLAALYESWSIPTAIVLVIPLGIIGSVFASALLGMERDIYFQVAMLTTAGLTCKNAILIVEFAKENVQRGMPLVEATVHAMRDRLRPILMTSLAFGLGVLPLTIATGAGAGAQRTIGTGVFGGMLAGTSLGIVFIPLFFMLIQRLLHSFREAKPDLTTQDSSDNRL